LQIPPNFKRAERLDSTDNEAEYIKDGCQEDSHKRTAEKIPFGEDNVAEQKYQANREKEYRLKQKLTMCQSQVTIHSTEKEEGAAMAGVETDPSLPYGCFARDNWRHFLHARL
jgi:hypothetical protein